VLKLVEKRAKASGILKRVSYHSFRATGVTEYMKSGGTIEIAQRIAGHTSPATTRIYDRRGIGTLSLLPLWRWLADWSMPATIVAGAGASFWIS
jgi:integrase